MKFAKQLEQELVPEWRVKYLNYKGGKKRIKAITKAIGKANAAPLSGYLRSSSRRPTPSPFRRGTDEPHCDGNCDGSCTGDCDRNDQHGRSTPDPHQPTQPLPVPLRAEQLSLTSNSPTIEYGSFVLTPPAQAPLPLSQSVEDESFSLPGPALAHAAGLANLRTASSNPSLAPQSRDGEGQAPRSLLGGGAGRLAQVAGAEFSAPVLQRPAAFSRLLSGTAAPLSRRQTGASDSGTLAQDLVRQRNQDFAHFLHSELIKVEEFYKLKETQAGQRLDLLREQLHEMRNRRTDEMLERRRRKENPPRAQNQPPEEDKTDSDDEHPTCWFQPMLNKLFRPGANSKALQTMTGTPVLRGAMAGSEDHRDYVRRLSDDDVPYRTAKRKLKLALQEFYRGLELLKAYALLNRTAFRKLNKKYDKTVHPRASSTFMNEHVNKAWFVNSDILDQHIRTVEDLYARYFEKGNHKIAVGKLRSVKPPMDESGSAFRCGVLLGTGLVFAIQGLISGTRLLLSTKDLTQKTNTSYLLQVYAGYFLMLYLFLLFCLNCRQWNKSKVNYPFIFELDQRHHLDWRQMAEFPCFFMFFFGIIFWLNFTGYGPQSLFLWYPVILIAATIAIIFLPLPIFGHNSRLWFIYSHWRLLLAGLYPVEFRDFFLGDIYCSLTYAVCNVELFFCLYANEWDNPVQCNSNHSRFMGFLTALPPIWRALQCIRRYYDTGNAFPHLANCGKYAMTIMSAVTLSMYRIQNVQANLGLFIAFSAVNAVYASFWDIFMDFSLMQTHSKNFLLRDILAFKHHSVYYIVMVLDPILRFGWIFYAVFVHNMQHSAVVSFGVSFAEVSRRGMWSLFRVENEHSANVAQYKASRDVPLPYRIEPLVAGIDSSLGTETRTSSIETQSAVSSSAPGELEAGVRREGIRRRGTGRRASSTAHPVGGLGKLFAEAHKQDFEKRRNANNADGHEGVDEDEDDDDEDDDDEETDDDRGAFDGGETGGGGDDRGGFGMSGANGHID